MFNTIRVLLITTLVSTIAFADVFMTETYRSKTHQMRDDMLSYLTVVIQL